MKRDKIGNKKEANKKNKKNNRNKKEGILREKCGGDKKIIIYIKI